MTSFAGVAGVLLILLAFASAGDDVFLISGSILFGAAAISNQLAKFAGQESKNSS